MSGWVLDYSLSLVNRTGAFYLTRDLKESLSSEWAGIRTWRDHRERNYSRIERKVRAKLMLKELVSPMLSGRLPKWSRLPSWTYLHMDPLYVLNDNLSAADRVLCHDIGPVSHPQIYGDGTRSMYGRAYEKIAKVKPQMTFVSKATRDAFVAEFGADFPRLDVIPLYLRDDLLSKSSEPAKKQQAPEGFDAVSDRFFISVGEVGARKGQADVIRGYALSNLAKAGIDYVICGPRGFGCEEVIELANQTTGVHLFSYVSDAALNWLYSKAEAFVLLTRLEGFGIPAIEAPLKGVLPLLSDDPAVQEVTGGFAPTSKSNNPEEVSAALLEIVEMTSEQKRQIVDRIREHARQYTFSEYLSKWKKILQC